LHGEHQEHHHPEQSDHRTGDGQHPTGGSLALPPPRTGRWRRRHRRRKRHAWRMWCRGGGTRRGLCGNRLRGNLLCRNRLRGNRLRGNRSPGCAGWASRCWGGGRRGCLHCLELTTYLLQATAECDDLLRQASDGVELTGVLCHTTHRVRRAWRRHEWCYAPVREKGPPADTFHAQAAPLPTPGRARWRSGQARPGWPAAACAGWTAHGSPRCGG